MTEQGKADPRAGGTDTQVSASGAEASLDFGVPSPDSAGGARVVAGDPATPVNVDNPLDEPYRTGSYLIYDFKPKDKDNFRIESALRASGSHQLDHNAFLSKLGSIPAPTQSSTLHLVDLREETHGFLYDAEQGPQDDYKAVSWYADNDFSNVGEPSDWIKDEEENRFGFFREWLRGSPNRKARIFDIVTDTSDNRSQQRMRPTRYWDVKVSRVVTEKQLFHSRPIGMFKVHYVRIPITDHCAPGGEAIKEFRALAGRVKPTDWVHFHCHGGDGRTTTFLALYDMWRWKHANLPNYPSLETFAQRQYKVDPPKYCLNPSGCGSALPAASGSDQCQEWKHSLALKRWDVLRKFHANPLGP